MSKAGIILFITIFFCSLNKWADAQINHEPEFGPFVPGSLGLKKEKCDCAGQIGYGYRVFYDQDNGPKIPVCDYSYDPLFKAPDSSKIRILRELLQLWDDTSVCCKAVRRYGINYWNRAPVSENYNLQIDALYTFNLIIFGANFRLISPYPVLYDKVAKKEINNNPEKIREVFLIYRKWFNSISKKGFKNYSSPLTGTRYDWFGASKQKIMTKKIPVHHTISGLGFPY